MAFTYKLELEDGTPADPPSSAPPYPHGTPRTRSRSAANGCSASLRFGPRRKRMETRC
jgi:hypothetical protein